MVIEQAVAITAELLLEFLKRSVLERLTDWWIKNKEYQEAVKVLGSKEFKECLKDIQNMSAGRPKDEVSEDLRKVLRPIVKAWIKAHLTDKKDYVEKVNDVLRRNEDFKRWFKKILDEIHDSWEKGISKSEN